MCLLINSSVKVRKDKDGWITGYKVVCKEKNISPIYNAKYKVGCVKYAYTLNRHKVPVSLNKIEIEQNTVERGIHVYLDKKTANENRYDGRKVIKVKGHISELRAVGLNNNKSKGAVFTKVMVIG